MVYYVHCMTHRTALPDLTFLLLLQRQCVHGLALASTLIYILLLLLQRRDHWVI